MSQVGSCVIRRSLSSFLLHSLNSLATLRSIRFINQNLWNSQCHLQSHTPDPPHQTPSTQPGTTSPPPSYNSSTRPQPAQPAQSAQSGAVSYGSLSDLTKNRPGRRPEQAFEYTPQPERQGYRPATTYEREAPTGTARRVPPAPGNYGIDATPPPPRRNIPGLLICSEMTRRRADACI